MNRTDKKRRSNNRKLLIIAVLLLLCITAELIILLHTTRAGSGKSEEASAPQTEETAEITEEETASIESGKAASHVISHRGSQGDDELTFAAYDRAIEAGSKMIEADMVVSKDGTVYLAHDDNTLDMTGYDGYFSGMTDGQIDELKTRSGNPILKLSDLFDKYGDSVTYIVDIKYMGSRNTDAFTEIVKKYELQDNVIAASFYFEALWPLEDIFPDMTKMVICEDQPTFDSALGETDVDVVCAPKEIMTSDNIAAAHERGKTFSAWTLNTEDEIRSAIELGADSYFTDDSGLAIKLEKELRAGA